MKNERAVWEYMNKRNDEGVIYINELDIVGHDRTGRPGKVYI